MAITSAHDAKAHFAYLQWEEKFTKEKPYYLYIDPPAHLPKTNFSVAQSVEETVHDLRTREHEFNLDDNGFTVMNREFELRRKEINDESVRGQYLPSLEVMLKELVGEDAEFCWFDWRTRSSDKTRTRLPDGSKFHLEDRSVDLEPVGAVHVDQSPTSTINRVRKHMGDRAEELLKGRVRLINIWRPCSTPVECHPLAIMDGSSVPHDKLVKVDVVRHSYIGESYYPLAHQGYKWYYVSRQQPEDVLVFKMYDSDQNVKARCVPHASFEHSFGENPRPRESIEARALVFTKN